VTPWAGLESVAPDIRYMTVLRDPVKRYASQYVYWLERKGLSISFEEFAALKELHNLQTTRLAGCANFQAAQDIISTKFLVIGVMEHFDEFILMLKAKLWPYPFDGRYLRRNATRNPTSLAAVLEKHYEAIAERNALDIALYKWVLQVVLPSQRQEYGQEFATDLDRFVAVRETTRPSMWKSYADYACRKFYYDPAIGLRRLAGRLSYFGSY